MDQQRGKSSTTTNIVQHTHVKYWYIQAKYGSRQRISTLHSTIRWFLFLLMRSFSSFHMYNAYRFIHLFIFALESFVHSLPIPFPVLDMHALLSVKYPFFYFPSSLMSIVLMIDVCMRCRLKNDTWKILCSLSGFFLSDFIGRIEYRISKGYAYLQLSNVNRIAMFFFGEIARVSLFGE